MGIELAVLATTHDLRNTFRVVKKLSIYLLCLAAFFRFYSIDHGVGYHPDERQIQMVAAALNLNNLDPKFYAYGSLPIYITSAIGKLGPLFQMSPYDFGMLGGRFLAAFLGVLTVGATVLLGRALTGRLSVGLLAGFLLATSPLHIQLSRFYTVDIWLCFFAPLFFLALKNWFLSRSFWWGLASLVLVAASVASKVSGALFGIVWIVVYSKIFFDSDQAKRGSLIKHLVAYTLIFLTVSFIFQPYLFLNFKVYYEQVKHQLDMVAGKFTLPYTINYINTTPYLYHVEQIFRFGLNPIVGLLGFVGTCWSLYLGWRRKDLIMFLIFTWVAFLFVSTAGQFVKFPRYLLPLYPFLCLAAAGVVIQIISSDRFKMWGKILLGLSIFASSVWASAFMNIFSHDHPTMLGARWLQANTPQGAKIAFEHWDDGLPLYLRGGRTDLQGGAHGNELPVYGIEEPRELERLVDVLSRVRIVALSSAKLYGSIMKNPEKYPTGVNYYQKLFDGSLGFDLVQSIRVEPQLGPFSIPTHKLDESLSVYDHPKVLFFEKKRSLTTNELKASIQSVDGSSSWGRDQMMSAVAGDSNWYAKRNHWIIFDVIWWFFLIEVLTWVLVPFVGLAFPFLPDRGVGIARTISFFGFGYLTWVMNIGLGFRPVPGNLWFLYFGLIAFLAGVSVYLLKKTSRLDFLLKRSFHIEALGHLKFYTCFVLVALFLRSWYSDIFWSETTMDFSFINYFYRSPDYPFQEPWAAGQPLKYYYLGFYFVAQMMKLAGIDTGVAYNLSSVLIFSLSASVLYGLFRWLRFGALGSGLAAGAVMLISNWIVPLKNWFQNFPLTFDLFWLGARTFEVPAFSEFPFWTFIFNDLHPHFIVQPLTLLLLVTVLGWLLGFKERKRSWPLVILGSWAVGILVGINSWDAINYTIILVSVFLGFLLFTDKRALAAKIKWVLFVQVFVVAAVGLVWISPFLFGGHLSQAPNLVFGLFRGPFNSPHHIIYFLAPWLTIIAVSSIWAGSFLKFRRNEFLQGFLIGFVFLALLCAVLSFKVPNRPLGVLLLATLVGAIGAGFIRSAGSRLYILVSGLLLWSAGTMMAVAEMMELEFRMNVIFKMYISVVFMVSVAALLLLRWLLTQRNLLAQVFLTVSLLGLLLGAVSTVQSSYAMAKRKLVPGPRPTLDGDLYGMGIWPNDRAIFEWINRNIEGAHTVIEAQGPEYQNFTRVTKHTGLPSVLGWHHHIRQRGVSNPTISDRAADIDQIYSTGDVGEAHRLAKKYNAKYVFLGEIERQKYGAGVLDKFMGVPQFEMLYSSGSSVIFKVR
jgi:YYY domain-containing protein